MYIKSNPRRFFSVWLIFFLLFIFIIFRLIYIQLFRANYLSSVARLQHNLYIELEPNRGIIFDRNLRPQTLNLPSYSLYANPKQIKNKEDAASLISSLLNLDRDDILQKLNKNKYFSWIARKLPQEYVDKIKKLKIEGLGFIKENKRSYPNGNLASHVIGFAGIDNVGLDGLELTQNSYLKGKPGWAYVLRDARQNQLNTEHLISPVDGFDLVLTIDEVIQFICERELDKAYKTFHAAGASIVVLNPKTGEILALVNRPAYNLNEAPSASLDERRNRSITDMFEPGSVFKIVTASASLEEKKFTETDKFFCENGTYRVANHILHDHTPHGWLTFRQVIEESSNIGVTKIAQGLGPEVVWRYAKSFGFGALTGVDMAGEIPGQLKETKFWSSTSIGAIPIGQEVGITALQLASAISVIANGGNLVRPYVLAKVQDKFGETIKEFKPQVRRRVISEDTAIRMKDILVGVVEEGTGQMAKVKGLKIAGKTGTAQKLDPDGRYSHSKFVASFIGFAPADDPKIAVAVVVDQPHPYYYGGVVSAPVFKKIAVDVLRYLSNSESKEGSSNIN